MQRYLLRRLLLLVPTLLLASILIFAVITLSPGDPVRMMLGTQATPEEIAVERERLGLDKSVPVRYVIWLTDVAQPVVSRVIECSSAGVMLTGPGRKNCSGSDENSAPSSGSMTIGRASPSGVPR